MADEPGYTIVSDAEPSIKSFKELALYKLDRTIAIIGIIVLGWTAIFKEAGSNPVTIGAIGALGTYLGVKGAK